MRTWSWTPCPTPLNVLYHDEIPQSVTGHKSLRAAGVTIEPLSATDAELAGALRSLPGGRALSLADRCCLGLTVRGVPADIRAADRAWAELDLPITIRLIR